MSVRLSVVVPVYNGRDFIGECLQSLVSQTTPVRVIVVDDHSPVEAKDLVDRYPVEYHRLEKNHGVGGARHFGAGLVDTEFIAFCDQDDVWHKDWAKTAVDYLDAHGDAHLVFFQAKVMDAANPERRRLLYRLPPVPTSAAFVVANPIVSPSQVVLRKRAYDAIGGFPVELEVSGLDDWVLWNRMAGNGYKMVYIDKPYVTYRSHPNQNSRKARAIESYDLMFGMVHEHVSGFLRLALKRRTVLGVILYRALRAGYLGMRVCMLAFRRLSASGRPKCV